MEKQTLERDVVIIGSGPAGLTAAIYTGRANLAPLLIDAPADAEKQTAPGGQLMITTEVENYPGFAEGIQGPDLMVEFRKQAERFGTEFLEAWITKVELQERPFTLHTDEHGDQSADPDYRFRSFGQMAGNSRRGQDAGRDLAAMAFQPARPAMVRCRRFATRFWWSWAAATRRWKRRRF